MVLNGSRFLLHAPIHKFGGKSLLQTAHLTCARGAVWLLLILYRSQPATPRANETDPSSLQYRQPVQQFSCSQTGAEMSEEGAVQTSCSKQEIVETSLKPEVCFMFLVLFCFKCYLLIHLNMYKTFTHVHSRLQKLKAPHQNSLLEYPKEQANQAGKHNWFKEADLSKYLPDGNGHKFKHPWTA